MTAIYDSGGYALTNPAASLVKKRPHANGFAMRYLNTPRVGFEPTTYRLTAGRSTVELSRKVPGGDIRFRILRPSILCAEGLNCCVRDGNRWDPFAIATKNKCMIPENRIERVRIEQKRE